MANCQGDWACELNAEQRRQGHHDSTSRRLCSLNTILQTIGQVPLVVEQRDDSVLKGILEEADEYMNLSLSNVDVSGPAGRAKCQLMYIKGTSIRCVHLPDHIPAEHVLYNRLKTADACRSEFRTRVRKQPPPKPEALTPLVGEVVSNIEADI
eukprot:CAMPEP_0119328534 /NCGR_PEP_ID=MMETSP1333-20130426/73558_1 /TAXON_ID=418940 /ORGANISM="Scyphosphaera apsteinii, Strain RCC1455" /LENGTH=152 /DNA_ID=CAMNT_0007337413 /DNA_START=66 /DNA_END=524 /DNA_ORIENTATION=+